MSGRILLVPSVAKGNGSGHLVRCMSLARALGPGAAVYVPEAKAETSWSAAELSLSYARELSGLNLVTSLRSTDREGLRGGSWDLVVLDRRATSREELAFWEHFGPVIAIDEGGEGRLSSHYLLDILPRAPVRGKKFAGKSAGGDKALKTAVDLPNKASLGFLDLPRKRRSPPVEFRRVLVTFGGEDRAGLSLALSRFLLAEGLVEPGQLTLVSGALRRGAPPVGLDGITLLGPVQDLKEHLAGYDLVLTQFGLTAFEAAWAGCGVILLNPSDYHRALSRAAGFPEIGVIRPDRGALRRFFSSPAEVLSWTASIAPEEAESLADYVASIFPSGPKVCPLCSSPDRVAQYRDADRSFFRCRSCGTLYLTRFRTGRKEPYKEAYFFEEYKRQYGRTYLEDWPNLQRLASPRLDIIERIAARSLGRARGLSILDVGCAYGPFLATALARGQEPYGLDAAEEAVDYVRKELSIPAIAGDFLDPAVATSFGGPFDVLTMWYVIEHFDDVDKALRASAALVRPGGILALSTPSGEGASARFDRPGFFGRSPEDHFTIWEPSRVRGILKAYGFRLEKIRITGHHPERLPFLAGLKGLFPALGAFLSRIFRWGDTFEVYAVREPVAESPAGFPRLEGVNSDTVQNNFKGNVDFGSLKR